MIVHRAAQVALELVIRAIDAHCGAGDDHPPVVGRKFQPDIAIPVGCGRETFDRHGGRGGYPIDCARFGTAADTSLIESVAKNHIKRKRARVPNLHIHREIPLRERRECNEKERKEHPLPEHLHHQIIPG